ncbi:restriction endonuclease subunit S [Thiobaca trueperi]|uniref:Type I restriction enzyme S subunit n=1 Tax=Thiobaca trueperi TaxID=127458 RepID=A0A4R3MQY4_9GAMM|nr:restriction endonuclease subunit S [Thiobaca trueperi]TCT18229.1 type I restriction enzyme S subunit [Thiobaca trueperi]
MKLDEVRELGEVYNGYTYFADGDLCVAKITPCFENGKGALAAGLTNGVGFGTTELHIVRPGPNIDQRFLFYVSIADDFRKLGESEMYGAGGQKRVDESFIKDWMPPLPPIDTQRRIVRFLDEKTARIDGLIEKKRALLDRLAEKRQALLTRAITKGLNPDAAMKPSGIDWLGDIPAHWDVKRFRFTARLISGSTPTTTVPEYWNGEIPWISPKDVKTDELFSSADRVTEYAVSDYGLKLHEDDHAIIVIRGMILARKVPVAVARGRYTINQDMKVIQSKGDVTPEFFQMYLSSIESFLFTLVAEAGHGTKALRTDVLSDVPVLLPPIEEQRSLTATLTRNREETDDAVEKVRSSIEGLAEYRSALITAAVTGQIAELR